jgi:hypothetical protein
MLYSVIGELNYVMLLRHQAEETQGSWKVMLCQLHLECKTIFSCYMLKKVAVSSSETLITINQYDIIS